MYASGKGVRPSVPVVTRWCGSSDLIRTALWLSHRRYPATAFIARGSLASSHAMIVGSSRYATPVIELVRCTMYLTWASNIWMQRGSLKNCEAYVWNSSHV